MLMELHAMHIAAGRLAGKESTCGKKIAYGSEESARKAAASMNAKPSTRSVLEEYPCAFCDRWHVGRKMSIEELRRAVEVMSEETP